MQWKRLPETIEARKKWAATLRKLRNDNPKLARLVVSRAKLAEKAMVDAFFSDRSSVGGLAELIKR